MRTIRRIIIENFSWALLGLLVIFGGIFYSLKAGHLDAVRLLAQIALFIIVAYPAVTFLECRRVWMGDPANDVKDVTVPMVIIGLVLFGCSYLI